MIRAILKNMGKSVEIAGEGAGLHILLRFHDDRSESELIQLAAERGVGIAPLSASYRSSTGFDGVIALGFGNISLSDLEITIATLSKAWFNSQ